MRTSRASLADLVEHGRDLQAHPHRSRAVARSRAFVGASSPSLAAAGSLAGVGLYPGLFSWLTSPAASATMEVQAAQTAAALENLAVAVYQQAAALPFMSRSPRRPADRHYVRHRTIADHNDHAGAFNAAAKKLGARRRPASTRS